MDTHGIFHQRIEELKARNQRGLLLVLPTAKQEYVANSKQYSPRFKALWASLETEENILLLRVFDDDVCKSLHEILFEGLYEYVSNSAEFLEVLDEVNIMFCEEHVRYAVIS